MRKRISLRAYVEAMPRSVRQYQIAAQLGIEATRFCKLLSGAVRPTKHEAAKLQKHGIEVAA